MADTGYAEAVALLLIAAMLCSMLKWLLFDDDSPQLPTKED